MHLYPFEAIFLEICNMMHDHVSNVLTIAGNKHPPLDQMFWTLIDIEIEPSKDWMV
jgi:hypothetical protein